MLCANAYGAKDFNLLGLYKNKIFKWGYFLKTNEYDINELIEKKQSKEKVQIIWVARYIKWKHPEIVLKLAKNLKKQNYDFEIKMLGTGKLINKINKKISKINLDNVIEVVGQVPSDKVKEYMEEADIFIGTSDKQEGWGAVVNESMNAGCAIVANVRMGSVPFLIKEGENGFTYKTYDELERKTKKLIENRELRKKIGKNAYTFITEKWTSSIAANNILKLFDSILNGEEFNINEGPASKE